MNNRYYIGLDVGTNSVGWAVTNQNYDLLRLRGKHAWGARIFSEAKDCKERRVFRSNRRRIARRKYRLQLLNTFFAEEISKVDNTFFTRLDNASYLFKDKKHLNISRNLVFKSKNQEKEFYKLYPTIWHLRKALVDNDEKAMSDIRNVYMAIHHIMKYRGNFLIDGEFNVSNFKNGTLMELNRYFVDKSGDDDSIEQYISYDKTNEIISILMSDENKKTKQKELLKLCNVGEYKEYFNLFVTAVTGGSYSLKRIVTDSEKSVDFTKLSFEEDVSIIAQELGDDFIVVQAAKELYDHIQLRKLLGEEKMLSNVMINIYENHKKDLELLKKIIVEIDNKKGYEKEVERLYYQLFKYRGSSKDKTFKGNYASFVHVESSIKRQDLSELNKTIEKILKDNKAYVNDTHLNEYNYLVDKAEKRELLKIIANESTSIIPHQLHLLELKIIIDNCSKKYAFLGENKDKLISLFTFRVPYYVGPLDQRSKYSNIDRKENVQITPWNYDKIVDDSKTRSNFMNKLTNTCSYLYSEKVMPKVSLDFEEYLVLDRLNVMLVNGAPLINEEKEEVLKYLLSRPKTTINQLKAYIASIHGTKQNDVLISNIKEDIPFEAKSHAHLSKVFDINESRNEMEYFIFIATVYADDKKSLKDFLEENYTEFTKEKINCILNLPTKKWATISHALLNDVRYIDDVGRALSILEIMRETNKNFQMVINDKEYNFYDLIKDRNNVYGIGDTNKQVDEILNSVPSITRRSIHQTLLIIDDIIKASEGEPSKIFIEVTRENDEKKKGKEINSRENEVKTFIEELLKKKNNPYGDLSYLKSEFEQYIEKVKGKHLYLYFMQMGIDVYTGKKIDINDVINSTKYDIDHIIPQSLIKDDSLDNLVLVDREYNQREKRDLYPIPNKIRNEQTIKLWKYLKEIGSIKEKKYNNLVRASEISLEEVENFINRQINVVNYSNIALRNVLTLKYPNTQIVFSKAQYPSHIRHTLEIAKNRDVNDAHHAVDAYLNIVAGNILSTDFSDVRKIYERKMEKDQTATLNMENVLDRNLFKDNRNLANKVFKNCMRRDALITFKVDYGTGPLYKQTLHKHSEGNLIPIHTKEGNPMVDTNKYGGYSDLSQAYLMAVQYEEKGKLKKFILRVPKVEHLKNKDNEKELLKTVVDNPNATNIKLIRKIYQNQKIRYDGCLYTIWTANENQNKFKMAYQNYLENEYLNYVNFASKELKNLDDSDLIEQEIIVNKNNEKKVVSKVKNLEIVKSLISISKKQIYDTCNYIVKIRDFEIDKFENLSLKKQINTINNLIKLFSRNNETATFENVFANVPTTPKLLLVMNFSGKKITLIYESPTGLFSHEVEI